jgi:hypothetical protein
VVVLDTMSSAAAFPRDLTSKTSVILNVKDYLLKLVLRTKTITSVKLQMSKFHVEKILPNEFQRVMAALLMSVC